MCVGAQLGDQAAGCTRADVQPLAQRLGRDRTLMLPMEDVFGACPVEQVLVPRARSVSMGRHLG